LSITTSRLDLVKLKQSISITMTFSVIIIMGCQKPHRKQLERRIHMWNCS